MDPTAICDLTELEIQMCDHCRKKGIYKTPPQSVSSLNLESNLHMLETSDLSIDEDGEVWVSPNEAFLQGRFGNGKHLF